MRTVKSLCLAALWAAIGWSAGAGAAPEFQGLRVEPPKAIRGGALLDAQNRPVTFPLNTGKWQLAVFGYTHCPDVCPMTLHKAALLLEQLGADAARLQPVFISIDSGRDNPAAMQAFTGQFDARIVGLTGDPEALQAVANEFGVLTRRFQGKTALAYTLEHSSFLYLLDPAGRARLMYPATADIPAMANDLRRLWREAGMAKQ
ncbi:MAG: SCO family protein [Gammaproteobacteria bacterium]|nr:SCO family protein [Gammaproteobacteria bacterium]